MIECVLRRPYCSLYGLIFLLVSVFFAIHYCNLYTNATARPGPRAPRAPGAAPRRPGPGGRARRLLAAGGRWRRGGGADGEELWRDRERCGIYLKKCDLIFNFTVVARLSPRHAALSQRSGSWLLDTSAPRYALRYLSI